MSWSRRSHGCPQKPLVWANKPHTWSRISFLETVKILQFIAHVHMEAVPRTNTGELPVLKEVLEFLFPHIGTFWQVNIPIIQCIVIKTLQTSLKITAAVDSTTPNKSPTVLYEEPWANLYKQIASCFSGVTGSGFICVLVAFQGDILHVYLGQENLMYLSLR